MQPNRARRRRLKGSRQCAAAFPEAPPVSRTTGATINEIEYKQRERKHAASPVEEIDESALDSPDSPHDRSRSVCGQKERCEVLARSGFILLEQANQRQGDDRRDRVRPRRTRSPRIWKIEPQ